jgi:chromosome segregation ATPase
MKIFLLILCLITASCATSPYSIHSGKELIELKESLAIKDEQISKRDEQIKKLEVLLSEKETQLKGKDTEIEGLKSKLRNFGIF